MGCNGCGGKSKMVVVGSAPRPAQAPVVRVIRGAAAPRALPGPATQDDKHRG